ncbi:receptor kinase-like protein Xa21 [Tanacetum coccineum]
MLRYPNGVLSSWNDSFHFCDWSGISCGKRHRRVTVIKLKSQGLEGSLSPHVGNLSFLRVLLLWNNSLQGTIPHELGHLSRLRGLILGRNKFHGVIPTNLSGCSELKELGLAFNKLVGSIAHQRRSVSSPNLVLFQLKVITLQVSRESITQGVQAQSFDESELAECIPYSVERGRVLHAYYSSTRSPNKEGVSGLWSKMLILHFVLLLLLEREKDDNTADKTPRSTSGTSHHQNSQFRVYTNWRWLNPVMLCPVEEDDLGLDVWDPRKLHGEIKRHEDCECNHFTGSLHPTTGSMLPNLLYLQLTQNQLTGIIPPSLSNCSKLQLIELTDNKFTGKLTIDFSKLKDITEVSLYNNSLSGSGEADDDMKFIDSLKNCSSFQVLGLYNCNLKGVLPITIGNLSDQFYYLDLGANQLYGNIDSSVGSIPDAIGNLSLLLRLYLDSNRLEGKIPSSLGNIPSTLGACTSLSFLSLEGNLFKGIIPSSFKSLRGVAKLDLSHNNLSGLIPKFLEEFSLERLDLSFNDFEGEVPVLGIFANTSEFSVLSNRRLCGGLVELGLPKCKETKIHKKRFPLFVIAILIASTLLTILCLVFGWFKKKSKEQTSQSSRKEQFLKVSYNQLLKATDGFSEANLIGLGGFSSVYKGILNDEEFVAVKVLRLQNRRAYKSFLAECEVWRNIRHRNLLKIITSCSSVDFQGNDFKALVYEFMSNGSSHDWLHSSAITSRLNLLQRINILLDVAHALDYLHNHCIPTIVHADLKPSNILLDDDMVAHVGDFGLARFLGTDLNQNSSTSVKRNNWLCPSSRLTTSLMKGLAFTNLLTWPLSDHVTDVIDDDVIVLQSTEANAHKMDECLASTLKMGVTCSLDSPPQRMNIKDVVRELQHVMDLLQSI